MSLVEIYGLSVIDSYTPRRPPHKVKLIGVLKKEVYTKYIPRGENEITYHTSYSTYIVKYLTINKNNVD